MTHPLPPRPNLEHLRSQAKALLAAWSTGDRDATQAFVDHLPKARELTIAAARRAPFRLADAQSVIARRSGFASWAALTRHVELLRSLEGEWHFAALQVDGLDMPPPMFADAKLLFDGDRFRMESPEANHDGRFAINAAARPITLDITFVEGPEAGNASYGILQLDSDTLTICLGLVGASRPATFTTVAGSGHALERLRRATAVRPAGVDGGVARHRTPSDVVVTPAVDPATFEATSSPILRQLEGEWLPVQLVTNGEEMRADWLPFGLRTAKGNEVTVTFGGQEMVHAKVRIDDRVSPIAIDYLHLSGAQKGKVSFGIIEWVGDEVRILMETAGHTRPTGFSAPSATQTLSQWQRRGSLPTR